MHAPANQFLFPHMYVLVSLSVSLAHGQLAHPFTAVFRMKTVGARHETLATQWLSEGGINHGIYYQYVKVVTQTVLGLFVGVGAEAAPGSIRAEASSIAIIVLQLSISLWCLLLAPGADKLEGLVYGAENMCSGTAVLLLYIASKTATNASSTTVSTSNGGGFFRQAGFVIQISAVVMPLILTAYDSILLPLVGACIERDENGKRNCCAGFKNLLRTCALTPIDFVLAAFGNSGQAGQLLQAVREVDEDLVEASAVTASAKEFSLQDADGDGRLNFTEFCALMRSRKDHIGLTDDQLRMEFHRLDGDASGFIMMHEFLDSLAVSKAAGADGRLDFEEFCQLIRELEGNVLESELLVRFDLLSDASGTASVGRVMAARALRDMDDDGDGLLSFEEFCQLVREGQTGDIPDTELRLRFDAIDHDGQGMIDMAEFLRSRDFLSHADSDGLLNFASYCQLVQEHEDESNSGVKLTEESLKDRFSLLDESGEGKISMTEYMSERRRNVSSTRDSRYAYASVQSSQPFLSKKSCEN